MNENKVYIDRILNLLVSNQIVGAKLCEPERRKMSSKKASIRNNTSDFLIFSFENDNNGIEVRIENKTVWLTQQAISMLYGIERSVVTKHLKNIFIEQELDENSVCANFAHTANDGKTYQNKYYSLEAILSVGYRTNSNKAT